MRSSEPQTITSRSPARPAATGRAASRWLASGPPMGRQAAASQARAVPSPEPEAIRQAPGYCVQDCHWAHHVITCTGAVPGTTGDVAGSRSEFPEQTMVRGQTVADLRRVAVWDLRGESCRRRVSGPQRQRLRRAGGAGAQRRRRPPAVARRLATPSGYGSGWRLVRAWPVSATCDAPPRPWAGTPSCGY